MCGLYGAYIRSAVGHVQYGGHICLGAYARIVE